MEIISNKIETIDLAVLGKPGRGRGVVAKAPIAPGEVLLQEIAVSSRPFDSAEPPPGMFRPKRFQAARND